MAATAPQAAGVLMGYTAPLMIYIATYIWCGLGTLIPIFNAETWAVVNGLTGQSNPFLIGIAAALGQCTAYTVYVFGGDWALSKLPKIRRKLESFDVEKYQGASYMVLVAAAIIGLPPLVMLAFVCRSINYKPVTFLVIALAGRIVRFSLLGLAPETFRQLGLFTGEVSLPTLPF